MERYHYLGSRPVVGEHVLYAAFMDGELVALLGWASAALRAPLRDAYIGWDEPAKRRLSALLGRANRVIAGADRARGQLADAWAQLFRRPAA